jgi:GT2 family glycosyltransferase
VPLTEAEATTAVPAAPGLLVLHAGVNGGYAGGVNAGLACLAATPGVDRFWVLNPDSAVPPQTARHFATEGGPQADFALMGGRVLYLEDPERVQIDGGLINWRTGATRNVNQGARAEDCTAPDPAAIDFISGASMVASRRFYEKAGPMAEDYFLYYEEVDWAMQRGAMPLAYCRDARVYHRAGTAIGSAKPGRVGSPLAIFFMHRNRIRFLQRYRPSALASGYLFSLGKAAQLCLKGHLHEARVLLAASFLGRPTQDVRGRLAPRAAEKAFAPAGQTGTSRQNDADRPSRP